MHALNLWNSMTLKMHLFSGLWVFLEKLVTYSFFFHFVFIFHGSYVWNAWRTTQILEDNYGWNDNEDKKNPWFTENQRISTWVIHLLTIIWIWQIWLCWIEKRPLTKPFRKLAFVTYCHPRGSRLLKFMFVGVPQCENDENLLSYILWQKFRESNAAFWPFY